MKRLEELRSLGIPPYPSGFKVANTTAEIISRFQEKSKEELEGLKERFAIAGRILSIRAFGKAAFLRVSDRSGPLQIFVEEKGLPPEMFSLYKMIDIGDFVFVAGPLFRTKTNELTLRV